MGVRTVLLFVLSMVATLFLAGCGGHSVDESDGFNVTHEEFSNILSEKAKDKGVKMPKQNEDKSVLTREEMCQFISEYINNTPYLKSKYIPVEILVEQGEESRFFKKMFQGIEAGSGKDDILLKQMENAKRMSIRTEVMKDGSIRTFYIYSEDASRKRFENILKDYDLIDERYREACLDACHFGYIDIFFSDKSYEAYFNPKEEISREEVIKVIDNLFEKEYLPLDCIKINYWEEDEFDNGLNQEHAYLCINDLPCLYAAKKLEKKLGENDKVYMTIGFDNKSFSLLYSSMVFGMLELPVSYFLERNLVVEVTRLDSENIKAGLFVCSEVICDMYRESFLEFANEVIANGDSDTRVFGDIKVDIYLSHHEIYVLTLGSDA